MILTYENRPEVDEHEQRNVREFLQWEDIGEHMIREALRKAVQWMESVARIRGRHDPLMVWLMQCFVNERMVQATMDPVDEKIREADKERKLYDVIQCERGVRRRVVKLGVTADFTQEKRGGENGHYGERDEGLFDLQPDLVLEVLWVRECCMVKNEYIR